MPRRNGRITLALLAAAACSPSEFVWSGAPRAELDAYLASFATACGDGFDRRAAEEEMLAAIRGERILWLGDHHESERLHTQQRRLLTTLHDHRVPMVMLLEAIGTQDDLVVQDFLGGETSLDELRRTIAARWPDSWLEEESLDAAFYRDLLTFSKERSIHVFGLEPTPRAPLQARDSAMADNVRSAAKAFPGHTIVVVVGQAHLLGIGDLVARTRLGGVVLGGVPPARLRATVPWPDERGFLRSNGGIWWFGAMFDDASPR